MSRQVFSRDTRLDTIKSAITFAVCGGAHPEVRSWAVRRWGEAGAPLNIDKAATPVLGFADMDPTNSTGLIDRELFKAVRERAVLFRLRGYRRTGFRIRSIAIGGVTVAWVDEGQPIPVLQPDIDNVGLEPAKVAGLSVWTEESLSAAPGIEQLVFDDLARAYADELDLAMFDPANDGSGAAPASLTHDAPRIASSGDPAVYFESDLAAMIGAFEGDLRDAYFVTSPDLAAGLAGLPVGRDMGARGGELSGVPVLTSGGIPAGQLTLVDPRAVIAAHDDDLELATSKEGAVQLDDAPDDPGTSDTVLVSLWQLNLVAIRAIGRVAWQAARPATVSLTGVLGAAS